MVTKINSLFLDLKKALKRLQEVLGLPPTLINQDATIQRFEFCFELAWKLMHSILAENGIEAYGPKNSIREAVKLELIDNPEKWLTFLKARNLTVHTYKEKVARKVYKQAKIFAKVLESFIETAAKYIKTKEVKD